MSQGYITKLRFEEGAECDSGDLAKLAETGNLKRRPAANIRYEFIHCFMRWLKTVEPSVTPNILGTSMYFR